MSYPFEKFPNELWINWYEEILPSKKILKGKIEQEKTEVQLCKSWLWTNKRTLEYEDFSGVLKEKEEDFSSPTINYNFISTTELKDLKKVLLYINEERNDEYEPYREQYHHWLKSLSRIIERFQFGSNDHDLRKRESNQPRDFREL